MLTKQVMVVTRCAQCGRELKTAQEWSQCRSNHTIAYWAKTDPRILNWCADAIRAQQPQGAVLVLGLHGA